MDEYNQSEIKELIWNESFRQWVLYAVPEQEAFWNRYLLENPNSTSTIQQAREIVLSLRVEQPVIHQQEIQQVIRNTFDAIALREESDKNRPIQLSAWYRQSWIRWVAVLLLIVGLGFVAYLHTPTTVPVPVYQSLVSNAHQRMVEKVNPSNQPLRLQLPDSSWVTLQKNSRISYPLAFNGSKREVVLSGEAFFEVVKNPAKPFVVYANELVTKVLGTSFSVKAYESDTQVSVEVKTGKVSVSLGSSPDLKAKATPRELEGVVLTPNQRMVFSRAEVRMTKMLVEQPIMPIYTGESIRFTFEDAPASNVFATLEKAYDVDIVYDEELMRYCPLTAAFTNESLYEKLDIICRAIEAQYEVIDGQIVIHSKGCK